MTKIFTMVLLLFTGAFTYAQTKPGDFLLGGNLSFSNQRGQTPDNPTLLNQTRVKFAPAFGIFLTKRVLFGFSTTLDYYSSTFSNTFTDTNNNKILLKGHNYKLTFGFGLNTSYYYPVCKNMFWVNTLDVNWGTLVEGDRVAALFSEDKPRQERERFVNSKIITGFQYFVKPNVSITVGITPLTLQYNYQKIVRNDVPLSRRDNMEISFSPIAKGFFIGVNYLIISEKDVESK